MEIKTRRTESSDMFEFCTVKITVHLHTSGDA